MVLDMQTADERIRGEMSKAEKQLLDTRLITWDHFFNCLDEFSKSLDNNKLTIQPDLQNNPQLKNKLLFDLIEHFPLIKLEIDPKQPKEQRQAICDKWNQDQLNIIRMISFLLDNGADPSARNQDGNTPLHQLLYLNSTMSSIKIKLLIKIFLEHEASLQTPNSKAKNPITAITATPIYSDDENHNLEVLSWVIRNIYIDMKLKNMDDKVRVTLKTLLEKIEPRFSEIFCAGQFEKQENLNRNDGAHILSYICLLIDELSKATKPEDFLNSVTKFRDNCEPHFKCYFPDFALLSAVYNAVMAFVCALIIGLIASLIIIGAPHIMIVGLSSAAIGFVTGYATADFNNDYKHDIDTQMNKLEEIFHESTAAAPRL